MSKIELTSAEIEIILKCLCALKLEYIYKWLGELRDGNRHEVGIAWNAKTASIERLIEKISLLNKEEDN